jgi:hypothetical protein
MGDSMKNLLILGSGRSGTSLMGGLLGASGYFMGDDLLAAREANPKGFFESKDVNRLNEDLITTAIPRRLSPWWQLRYGRPPQPDSRWVARLPVNLRLRVTPELDDRIKRMVSREPFCFKDPRLSYSLPAWIPHLRNTGIICVFRHPVATAKSLVRECQDDRRLHCVGMTPRRALQLWKLMYLHVLRHRMRYPGDWLFVHYDQLLSSAAFPRIERFSGAPVDASFPDASLQRSRADAPVPRGLARLYGHLCELAEYDATSDVSNNVSA